MSEMRWSRCPICGSTDAMSRRSAVADTRIFACPACGAYEISGAALYTIVTMPPAQRASWLARAKQAASDAPPRLDRADRRRTQAPPPHPLHDRCAFATETPTRTATGGRP